MDNPPVIPLAVPPRRRVWRSRRWRVLVVGLLIALCCGGLLFVEAWKEKIHSLRKSVSASSSLNVAFAHHVVLVRDLVYGAASRPPVGGWLHVRIDWADASTMDPARAADILTKAREAFPGPEGKLLAEALARPGAWTPRFDESLLRRQTFWSAAAVGAVPAALWIIAFAAFSLPAFIRLALARVRPEPPPPGVCTSCGYSLAAHTPDHGIVTCPECGEAQVVP